MQLTRNRANRKTVGRPKGGASAAPAISVGQCLIKLKAGKELLKNREANLPASSQPPAKPSLCFNNGGL